MGGIDTGIVLSNIVVSVLAIQSVSSLW